MKMKKQLTAALFSLVLLGIAHADSPVQPTARTVLTNSSHQSFDGPEA